eukprot:CAMPEP_0115177094 /NCGR_PEP_ID=MMETSP0270-20121206/5205_1 /TAXON_ID=71861 /ORGANISM="Scrippsiella trochoidea, Strain CCMP3099" /LENGTH=46 /DNA_ID= /DNA_START= /DNA_END= /DNA_ORIENTATION=
MHQHTGKPAYASNKRAACLQQANTHRFDTTALLATYGWLSSKATSA